MLNFHLWNCRYFGIIHKWIIPSFFFFEEGFRRDKIKASLAKENGVMVMYYSNIVGEDIINDKNEIKMVNIEKDLRKFCRSKGVDMSVYDGFVNSYLEPYVIEERNMPITSISVYSRLLMDRVLFVNGTIESTMANILTAQLLWLDQQSDKPINMYINSPGGSVIDGLQLIDTMNFINAPISTTSLGMAASMGAVILSCGEKGKRFVLPHSRVMIHQASGGFNGKSEDVKTSYEQLLRCQKDIYEILSKNIGLDYKEIEALCSNTDKWFIGQEAVDLGIADEVVKTVKKEGE